MILGKVSYCIAAMGLIFGSVTSTIAASADGSHSAPTPPRLLARGIYTITSLGQIPDGQADSIGRGLNNVGDVVGKAASQMGLNHAFLYHEGRMHDIGCNPSDSKLPQVEGYPESLAQAINDHEDIVGFVYQLSPAGVIARAFVMEHGKFVKLGTLPGGNSSTGMDINDRGEIVGKSTVSGGADHAFLAINDKMIDLNEPLASTSGWVLSEADAINDAGHITGHGLHQGKSHAFVLDDHALYDLGTLDGGDASSALAIDNDDDVVGSGTTAAGDTHAFLILAGKDGKMLDLGTLGGKNSVAYGVTKAGEIVGMSQTKTGENHAMIVRDGLMIDLNDTLPLPTKWVLTEADAINDLGQITGAGYLDGQLQAYLLTPIATKSPDKAKA